MSDLVAFPLKPGDRIGLELANGQRVFGAVATVNPDGTVTITTVNLPMSRLGEFEGPDFDHRVAV